MNIAYLAQAERRAVTLSISFALLLATVPALAQTCANPIPLTDGQTHAYDTCIATNSLPYFGGGELVSPTNDVVYRIHTNGTPSGSFVFNGSPWGLLGVVMSQCNEFAPLAAVYDANYDGPTLPIPTLPSGDNFLVVTGDPSISASTCGAYQVTAHITDSLPPARGSCGAPITYSSGTRVSGNTCTATNTLSELAQGVFESPQNDLAYRIHPASIVDRRIYINATDFDATAFLLSSCSVDGAASATAEIPAGSSGVLTLPSNLTADQYLVVTGNPVGAPAGCGHFDFSDVVPGVVTDPATFVAALRPGYYVETFSQPPRGATENLIHFSSNGYAYGVTPTGTNAKLRYVTDTHGASQALSVVATSSARSMRISLAGLPVNAIGGMFNFTTGLFQPPGTITVTIRSGTKINSYSIRGSTGFRGFGSRNRIDEVTISSSAPLAGNLMMDNLIVGWADSL